MMEEKTIFGSIPWQRLNPMMDSRWKTKFLEGKSDLFKRGVPGLFHFKKHKKVDAL